MGKSSEQATEVVQVTLFDDLLDQLQTSGTSADIAQVIEKLKKQKTMPKSERKRTAAGKRSWKLCENVRRSGRRRRSISGR